MLFCPLSSCFVPASFPCRCSLAALLLYLPSLRPLLLPAFFFYLTLVGFLCFFLVLCHHYFFFTASFRCKLEFFPCRTASFEGFLWDFALRLWGFFFELRLGALLFLFFSGFPLNFFVLSPGWFPFLFCYYLWDVVGGGASLFLYYACCYCSFLVPRPLPLRFFERHGFLFFSWLNRD